nr:SGNH hydrolase-type esterase domain-containing protein [Tanacetum cinerariifolium]
KEGDDSDDGNLDIYEPRVRYNENDGIYAEVVIFVNQRLVRLMDVTVEQWLDLMYGGHTKVNIKVKEGVVSIWLVQSYKKQFDEYIEIKKQWVTRRINADTEHDPSEVEFAERLALKSYYHKTMDWYTKNALWIYWTRGDDEVELTDEEFFNLDNENLIDKDEVAKIFRFETDIFDFEPPICKAFKEFNYLLKIVTTLHTSDILELKTYEEFKNEWMYE